MDNNPLNEIFATNGMRGAIVGVLAILSLFLLAQTISLAKDFGRSGVPATDTITVNGDGQATLPPDVARVTFTVQNTAVTVAEAQAATTKQSNAAIAFVKAQGVAEKDVKTQSYNIYPQYSYPVRCLGDGCLPVDNTPKVTGYQVSQSILVTVRDLSSVGAL
ncbi:MAG: SIMPL domain-containing protein, partial [Minisyncoccia bacterium]